MAIRRVYTLYYNVTDGVLYDVLNDNRELGAEDTVIPRGDSGLILLHLRERNPAGELAAYGITGSPTYKFAVKDPQLITGTDALIFSDNDAFNVPGDWADVNPAQGKISIRFSSNTATLQTFLAAAKDERRTVIAEVEITAPGEAPFTLAQFYLSARNDVIRGSEGDPAPSGPTYATSAELAAVRDFYLKPDGDDLLLVHNDVVYMRFAKP